MLGPQWGGTQHKYRMLRARTTQYHPAHRLQEPSPGNGRVGPLLSFCTSCLPDAPPEPKSKLTHSYGQLHPRASSLTPMA